MRVAYQAGVIRALLESGLTFAHADGTSGGTINLAMLFSGLSPVEMCDRWRTLDVHDFASFLPLDQYLRATDLMAMGDADGVINKSSRTSGWISPASTPPGACRAPSTFATTPARSAR